MSADGALATHPPKSEVALIIALDVERACFPPQTVSSTISILQCGPGAERAAVAAAGALAQGARALVSCGLAGALSPALEPGSVVLPSSVLRADGTHFDTDFNWRERLAVALRTRFAVDEGPLLDSADVIGTPGAKRRAAETSGAVAVDMESGAVARAAVEAGVPFVVLRVVADGAADSLPAGVDDWVDGTGRRRLAPIVDAALRPAHWPMLWMLARRYRKARGTLTAVAGELMPKAFLFHA
jgi:adenosylhomocysteine nucleosidase